MNAWCYDDNAIMLLKSLIPRKGELIRSPMPELGGRGGLPHPVSLGDLVIRSPQPGGGCGDGSRGLSQSPLMIKCKFFYTSVSLTATLLGQGKKTKFPVSSYFHLYGWGVILISPAGVRKSYADTKKPATSFPSFDPSIFFHEGAQRI